MACQFLISTGLGCLPAKACEKGPVTSEMQTFIAILAQQKRGAQGASYSP